MAQITLGCALGLEARNPDFDWRSGHARLQDWYAPIAARPSFQATAPPKSALPK
jgi:glutathione S-transferase